MLRSIIQYSQAFVDNSHATRCTLSVLQASCKSPIPSLFLGRTFTPTSHASSSLLWLLLTLLLLHHLKLLHHLLGLLHHLLQLLNLLPCVSASDTSVATSIAN